ncbi:MAG: hypothetical protein JW993_20525 [Sedimentisphaerales bacterium]|nr:hypothetical protein [Sedimentisphaerales bacterium]
MANHHQIKCPCCGQIHGVDVPSRFARVRRVHLKGRGPFLNYVGFFHRLCEQIERRCPNTRQLYHIVCQRTQR